MNITKLFKKKKYLNCPHLKHSLHFFYNEIRACCSNVKGPTFYSNYDGETIDWKKIYNIRKNYIKKINSIFSDGYIPDECKGCYHIDSFLSDKKIDKFDNKVNCLFFQNNMSCNASCIYCVFADVGKGAKYKVVPIVESLIEQSLLDKNSCLILSGGEITIAPDFEDLVNLLIQHVDSPLFLATSGIKYSKTLEKAIENKKCWQTISLDSGCPETYKIIKKVDCFDIVVNNIKKYISATDKAKEFIVLKYILIDNINDNMLEIQKFFNIVKSLGIKHVRLDVNFQEYTCTNDKLVPKHYLDLFKNFKELASKYNINVCEEEQTRAILYK